MRAACLLNTAFSLGNCFDLKIEVFSNSVYHEKYHEKNHLSCNAIKGMGFMIRLLF